MRLDLLLVEKKLVSSRTQAQDLIKAGFVILQDGASEKILTKANLQISEEQASRIRITKNDLQKYVSRGGTKLESAVRKLNLQCANKCVLDVGQSTGGFTDFLIQNNASSVVGIDVGHGQLHESIKANAKVSYFEGLHAKDLSMTTKFLEKVPSGGFDLIVMDVSFISITKLMHHLKTFLKTNGEFIFLVKPQYELTAKELDKNGIVKDSKSYQVVQARIELEARQQFGHVLNYFPCDLAGKDGNQEFFIYGTKVI